MLYLDLEFRNVTEEFVELVCCTTMLNNEVKEWWLLNNDKAKEELKTYLLDNKDNNFVSYAVQAEARSFLSLGLEPLDFTWIDLYLEWRCLTNHNDKLNWGNQLVNGKVKFTRKPPPKWERTEEDNLTSFKHTHSLAEATYKLTGLIRDTEHKDKMRDLIISGSSFTFEEEIAIQNYCTDDVKFLPELLKAIVGEYKKLDVKNKNILLEEMKVRARYAAITAKMESWGYPIDYQKTKNFSNQVGSILDECQREINQLFPDIKPFKFDRKTSRFTWDQKRTREWIKENCDVNRWLKTDTNNLSLSLEAFTRVFDFKHNYPKDNFGAQIVRYLKLKQNLNGFSPNSKTKSFWDFVGKDQRVRPYFGIYGSQSSRSQPSSSGFLFLKPAWMRSLCVPPKGKAIASFDYSSEEFLVSALWANDRNMIEAYRSGDVYLAYGKLIEAIPKEGTKAEYKKERDLQKPIVLGMSYLMSKYGLAESLTNATGKKWTEEEAQEKIDEFKEAFPGLAEKQEEIMKIYEAEGHLKLPCGWYMFGDNDNHRSVCNFPIQGLGGSIMRKAVDLAVSKGLKIILTLHDALYLEYDEGDFSAIDKLYDAMREAFIYYFDDKKSASLIRLDGYTWSDSYEEDSTITTPNGLKIDCSKIYVDERAISEFEQFKKYFEDRTEDLL